MNKAKKNKVEKTNTQTVDVEEILSDSTLPIIHKLIFSKLVYENISLQKELFEKNRDIFESLRQKARLVGYQGWKEEPPSDR
ncbi:MAG: hypothetical protein NZO16_07080 [Deltaproteobacteria bacterium]|nr:hypothetical protein [Deltaproteobacteria bacterium]